MKKITLISLIYFILSLNNLHATKQMAEKESQSCVKCHKTSRGGRKGKPNLRSEGIRYIKKLVEKEGYVPTSRHRQLTFLAAKIKANKLKIDSKAKAIEDAKKKIKQDKLKKIEEEKKLAEEAIEKEKQDKILGIQKKKEEEKKKEEQKRLIAEGKIDPVTLKLIVKKMSESVKKSLGKSDGSSMVRGSKTIILKRKNVGPRSYDHLSDWEFDDYF
ncbi:MAG: hypothetical protein COB02_03135 [Candidatus Cloacimonadota bacterium]|nr:MAG: hypothetical protein COB02_03135 [Candidatus Cloacimonadota bacterium]